jgi:hypothetical protein
MAQVKVMYWRDIPYAVRAIGPEGQVSRQLPAVFQEAVDEAAMTAGRTAGGDYSAAFHWGPEESRPGSPAAVADAVVAEIVTAYPPDRLRRLTGDRDAG